MDEQVPECPSDIPLAAAVRMMADLGVDHLFFLHRAGGRVWPASVLSLRDVVKALAGPEYIKNRALPRPSHADGSVPAAVRVAEQTMRKLVCQT